MRRNERERLQRRAAYQEAQELKTRTMTLLTFDTQAELDEFNRRMDVSCAYHEAGHAVAAWMLGLPITEMRYVAMGVKTSGQDLMAVTEQGSLTAFISEFKFRKGHLTVESGVIRNGGRIVGRIDDGGVYARQQAFITLAGPFAELFGLGDDFLPKEALRQIFERHGAEATAKLQHLTVDMTDAESRKVLSRLVDLAKDTMQQPRVLACVTALARRFHAERKLSGDEIVETILGAWNKQEPAATFCELNMPEHDVHRYE